MTSYSRYALEKMDRSQLETTFAEVVGADPHDDMTKKELVGQILANQTAADFDAEVADAADEPGDEVYDDFGYVDEPVDGGINDDPVFGSDGEFLGTRDQFSPEELAELAPDMPVDEPDAEEDEIVAIDATPVMIDGTLVGGTGSKTFADDDAKTPESGPRGGSIVNGITTGEYRKMRMAGSSPHKRIHDQVVIYAIEHKLTPDHAAIDALVYAVLEGGSHEFDEISLRWYNNVSGTAQIRLWKSIQRSIASHKS